ncbi:hypothetical protein KW785_00995 [Candidatus Parcubacteria bacterium]|nr:hypothetical protein [Candidatus Parcubacteria bacterium]
MSANTVVPRRVRLRVTRGARRLDYVRPGWELQIDTKRLDLGDRYECVAGQLEGDYSGGYDRLKLPCKPVANGMYPEDAQCGSKGYEVKASQLTQIWKTEITTRLARSAPAPQIILRPARFSLLQFFHRLLPI